MDSKNRGVIHSRDRAKQINDFSGMRFVRNITPTDIDGALELGDNVFIFFEMKYGKKEIDYGQKVFLERTCNAINNSGKNCLVIHGTHENANPEIDVNVAICKVVQYYSKSREWIVPDNPITIFDLCKTFIAKYDR